MAILEYCDLCGKKRKNQRWENNLRPLELEIYVSSRNPMGEIATEGGYQTSKFYKEEVCDDCREEIAQLITDFIKDKYKEGRDRFIALHPHDRPVTLIKDTDTDSIILELPRMGFESILRMLNRHAVK